MVGIRGSCGRYAHKIVSGDFPSRHALDFRDDLAAWPHDSITKLCDVSRRNPNLSRKFVARHAGIAKPLCQLHGGNILAGLKFSQPKNNGGDFRVALWYKVNDLAYLHPMAAKAKAKKVTHFLREWRKFRGMSQERLAGRIECSTGLVSQWESGETKLTEDKLHALAGALQCEPGDILSRDPNASDYKLWRIINGLAKVDQEQALRVIEALTKKSA